RRVGDPLLANGHGRIGRIQQLELRVHAIALQERVERTAMLLPVRHDGRVWIAAEDACRLVRESALSADRPIEQPCIEKRAVRDLAIVHAEAWTAPEQIVLRI